ncbi:MAG: glycosyltransferase family 2 protein [Candidatus Curtissbacteria bacterium]
MVQKTSLVILTRNEINGVKALIRKIPFEVVDEFFAVDYKSTDGTPEFFKSHHIPVVSQTRPGRGEAFRIAVSHAKGDFLIFFSPDGNENPADILKLVRLLGAGNDLVIASRFMKGSRNEEDDKALQFRAWANKAFTLSVRLFWGGNVTDTINGYRAIRKGLFKKLNLDAEGFAIEFQMTIRALKAKARIAEIPTIEGNRIGGASTSYAIPTGFKFIYYLLREVVIGTRPIKKEGSFPRSLQK